MEKSTDDVILQKGSMESLGYEIHKAVPTGENLIDLVQNPRWVQRKLTQQHMAAACSYMIEHTCSPRDAAHLHSLGGKGAGAWLTVIPESTNFAFQLYEYRLACLLKLGLQLPAVNWINKCECGAVLDDKGYHLLTCKKGGDPVWLHDSIMSEWSDCLRQLQIHHKRDLETDTMTATIARISLYLMSAQVPMQS